MAMYADSPTMAEEMFARRLAGDSRGGGGSGSSTSSRGRPGKRTAAAGVPPVPGGAGTTPTFSGIDERRAEEEAGEEGVGFRRAAGLRLSSAAQPLANDFPAPMTNAFPTSTDTPQSNPPGGGGGGKKKAMSGPLSPSPVSSIHLRGPSPAASELAVRPLSGEGEGPTIGSGAREGKWGRLGSGASGGAGGGR
ncbi:unnamed protein product [Scytosiphon promiscuus]